MYCHGTEIPSKILKADNITPSLYTGSMETHRDVRNMGLGWASKGFVVFIPDYIGFGITLTKDILICITPRCFFPTSTVFWRLKNISLKIIIRTTINCLLRVGRWLVATEIGRGPW